MKKNLPPTDDAFYQHILHYAYQLFIWWNATTAILNLVDHTDYGYVNGHNMLQPRVMHKAYQHPNYLMPLYVCVRIIVQVHVHRTKQQALYGCMQMWSRN